MQQTYPSFRREGQEFSSSQPKQDYKSTTSGTQRTKYNNYIPNKASYKYNI